MQTHTYQRGDLVIYTVTKQSAHPGPRAREIHPSELGEDYSYLVDKFWMVAELPSADKIIIVTRRGKTRQVSVRDPMLRKANWWQRFRHRNRFPYPAILSVPAEKVAHADSAG